MMMDMHVETDAVFEIEKVPALRQLHDAAQFRKPLQQRCSDFFALVLGVLRATCFPKHQQIEGRYLVLLVAHKGKTPTRKRSDAAMRR
jgi:hypothetical protein